ncbi:MliC family protein [Halomonas sp. Bachu 37]|uniref:MliC family protein n=1 Tax=Halomonas kashgarensis TaxID=3084920 RepID=UPI0032169D30
MSYPSYSSASFAVATFLMLAGCAAPMTNTSSTPATPATNSAPLLPSALFTGGAERFTGWYCQPAEQHLVSAVADNEELRLWSLHGAWHLPPAVVASGARYQQGEISFWNRGEQAQVETPRGQLQCQQTQTRSALTRNDYPGVMFHGQGNEPGWTVDLAHDRPELSVSLDYGEREFTRDYRIVALDNDSGRVVLESTRPDQSFTLRLEAGACFDGMSGKPYPARVTLTVDGTQYSGCGQGIAPGA